jgi:hypothetical protein
MASAASSSHLVSWCSFVTLCVSESICLARSIRVLSWLMMLHSTGSVAKALTSDKLLSAHRGAGRRAYPSQGIA